MISFFKDIVICCNPRVLPTALLCLLKRLRASKRLLCTFYVHSSVKSPPCVDLCEYGFTSKLTGVGRSDKEAIITWIWKDCEYHRCVNVHYIKGMDTYPESALRIKCTIKSMIAINSYHNYIATFCIAGDECEMLVSPLRHSRICKEVNVCRYLMRLLGYYPVDNIQATLLDEYLDLANSLLSNNDKERADSLGKLVKCISKCNFLMGGSPGIADLMLYSTFKRATLPAKWSKDATLERWSALVAKTCL